MAQFWWEQCHQLLSYLDRTDLEAALNERRGFGKSACTREEGCLEHHVIHIEAAFCLETSRGHRKRCNVLPRSISLEFSASSRSVSQGGLTSGLACNAPSTTTEAIVARASSGVTSGSVDLTENKSPAQAGFDRGH